MPLNSMFRFAVISLVAGTATAWSALQPEQCSVHQPGDVCGVQVNIAPFVAEGGPFGGFQSVSGTSYQREIVITFSPPVQLVTVTAVDPDYVANDMLAYAGRLLLDSARFAGDNQPNVLTTSTRSVRGCAISRVVLRPDVKDYIAYRNLEFIKTLPGSAALEICP